MKIAIVNQIASTGGWRYVAKLSNALKQLRSDIEITVFFKEIEGAEDIFNKMKSYDIAVCPMPNKLEVKKFVEKKKFKNEKINKFSNKIRRIIYNLKNFFRKKEDKSFESFLEDKDVILYAWPYRIKAPKVSKTIFFIPHDFIYTHSWGMEGIGFYNKNYWKTTLEEHETFVQKGAVPIVSSDYIKDEFNHTFPNSKEKPHVVYLSTLNDFPSLPPNQAKDFFEREHIKDEYVLFASNVGPHKNFINVLGAWYYVKQKYPNLKLILSGYGNNDILGKVNTPYYMDHTNNQEDYDIKSTGLLSGEEFSTLMQNAKMVINASLCEAGNGSGLDAWDMGVPVVMSNIPAFQNQIDKLGVKAELFDPKNSHDIARAIIKLLDNPELAKENVRVSKEALQNYTWKNVAEQYLEIFEERQK